MKKLLNKKGFTLMEMLIVVAIIVILVAISIPAFSNSLESAKKATDAANLRSAKAAFVVQTMADASAADKITLSAAAGVPEAYYYDYRQGKFVAGGATEASANDSEGECTDHSGAYISIIDGKVVWTNGTVAIAECN